MKIACILNFTKDLRELNKKSKDRYYHCLDDILDEIKDFSINELALKGDALTPNIISPEYRYRKIRIENSLNSGGKSSGFRLICVISVSADAIIFLKVYPKSGRLGINDIGTNEKKRLLKEMIAENGRYYILNPDTRTFELPVTSEEDSI